MSLTFLKTSSWSLPSILVSKLRLAFVQTKKVQSIVQGSTYCNILHTKRVNGWNNIRRVKFVEIF